MMLKRIKKDKKNKSKFSLLPPKLVRCNASRTWNSPVPYLPPPWDLPSLIDNVDLS